MFNTKHPVGWKETTFVKPTDPNLHHILTYDHTLQDFISVIFHWNKKYSEMMQDEKYGFQERHYHLKLSVEEATALRDALDSHIKHLTERR